MSRLPQPGLDKGTWGDVLNDYLSQSLNTDGSLKAVAQSNVSGLTATLVAKAPLASPTFTGTVTVPTPVNNTDAATKAYVDNSVTSGSANGAMALTAVAVQGTSYAATVNTINPIDVTASGTPQNVTVTLPSAPVDKSRITVKRIDASPAFSVAIAAGGSDVFNKAGGSTSLNLQVQNQAISLQYTATGSIWYVVSDDIPAAWVVLGITKTVSSAYTLTLSDHVLLANAGSGPFTVTLPNAVGYFGRFTVTETSGSAVSGNYATVVTSPNTQTINGAASVTVGSQASGAAYSSVDLVSDGANWHIV
jgi:hypothetical protein